MLRALGTLVAIGGILLVVGPPPAQATDDGAMIALPLVLHTPTGALDDHTRDLLTHVIEAYAPHGLCFVVSYRTLAEAQRVLHTIRERRALHRAMVDRAANAFLVDRAHDPNPSASTVRTAATHGFAPSGLLGGAHVPARGHRPGTYVFVTRDARGYALAHELGHFLGAGHHADPENIMGYSRTRHRFDDSQARVFRARARRYIARHDVDRVSTQDCAAHP
jgi:hypothetical protein